jgi:hypothetical protein
MLVRAFLGIRPGVHYRSDAFTQGLERLGYCVFPEVTTRPDKTDVLVIWNRYRENARAADAFEFHGLPVLIAENAAWGNEFQGERWYSIARNYHNTAGGFPVGDSTRWDALGVDLPAFRAGGDEVVILPQRGIGPPGVAMPLGWPDWARKESGGRVRPHPGVNRCVPLEDDLARARCVWTWGSGAAIKALLWGIPVRSWMPGWVGEQDNTEEGRLAMFRRLAWAQWRLGEIKSGEAFTRLLA